MINKEMIDLIYVYTPNLILGICILVFFWFFSKIVQYGINNFLRNKNSTTNVSNVIAGIIKDDK